MRLLINLFLKYRDSLALAVFFAGVPLVYFLRDGLKFAPDNAIFSIALIFGPFVLTLPFKNFKYFETPHRLLYPLLIIFLLFSFAYFYLKQRAYFTVSFTAELLNYVLIFFILFAALFIRNSSINKPLIYLVLLFSTISAVALIYYISQNPFYVLGQRASFSYGEDSVGNPHINSKVAFFGVVAGVLAMKYGEKVKLGIIFPGIVILLSFVVLFLTQTMLAFLSVFIFGSLFLLFNFSIPNLFKVFKLFFTKWYVLLIMVLGAGFLSYKIKENEKLLDPAFQYFSVRYNNIKETVFNEKKDDNIKVAPSGDDSANTRMMHVNLFFERLEESIDTGNYHIFLFGQGYKNLYMDNPHLEMFDSFGLVGFLLYSLFFVMLVKACIKEMRNPEGMGTELLAYIFIYFFISNFIAGQMIDYTRMASYIIFSRFLSK